MDKRKFKKIVRKESEKACSRIKIYNTILHGFRSYQINIDNILVIIIGSSDTITSHKIYSVIMNKMYNTTKFCLMGTKRFFIP